MNDKFKGRVVEGVIAAYQVEHADSNALKSNDPNRVLGSLNFSCVDMSKYGWSKVGAARIEVTLVPEAELIAAKVEALRKQIQADRAEVEVRCRQREKQIQNLLAISYDGKA